MHGYWFLAAAILLEIFSTSMLKASAGFTRLVPSFIFAAGMGASFYMLSLALKTVPLAIAYVIWSGLGWCSPQWCPSWYGKKKSISTFSSASPSFSPAW